MSVTALQGTVFHSCLHTFPSKLLFFWCRFKYAIVHSRYYLSLSFSTFFKQSHSMYKSDRFLHGMSLDRKMGIQKGQGMNLFMIPLLALSYSDTWKNLKSLVVISLRIGGIRNRSTVCSDRPNLILQPFSLFPSALHSPLFCLSADPLTLFLIIHFCPPSPITTPILCSLWS